MNVTTWTNTTTSLPPITPTGSMLWGYLSIILCVFCWGTNFIPVKHYETGDGVFFQFIMCTAIWSFGFLIDIIKGSPQFYALPMLGGFVWTTGN